jgi:Flp pilus assembly protein TadG
VRDERGQVSVMIVGFMLILLVMVAVVVDASAAYLQRSGLDTVADGAALAGTEALDLQAGYEQGLDDLQLSRQLVDDAVRAYLDQTGARTRFPGLGYSVSVTGNEVVVHVTAPLDLPLRVPETAGSTAISATGSAVLDNGAP